MSKDVRAAKSRWDGEGVEQVRRGAVMGFWNRLWWGTTDTAPRQHKNRERQRPTHGSTSAVTPGHLPWRRSVTILVQLCHCDDGCKYLPPLSNFDHVHRSTPDNSGSLPGTIDQSMYIFSLCFDVVLIFYVFIILSYNCIVLACVVFIIKLVHRIGKVTIYNIGYVSAHNEEASIV